MRREVRALRRHVHTHRVDVQGEERVPPKEVGGEDPRAQAAKEVDSGQAVLHLR